ncbi:hypothetical protein cand_015010 [Cryptosporidium andersoni]|uniref:AD domain-containing protein n=1 Tax=Cryptosporidium andersoni TaxID=117008 RepID=A0A1J4MXN2_9CRYT|nr:hypothetical protein cand_015010 [Cryptosporidium andersoni]
MKSLTISDSVTLTTLSNEEYHGCVCCIAPNGEFTVLKEDIRPGFSTFQMIRNDIIKKIAPCENSKVEPLKTELPSNYISIINDREEVAVNKIKSSLHCWGTNVTPMGQATFNFIHKTHPNCRWNGSNIEVMGITVAPPYLPENCIGTDQRALERIRRVIEKFQERIQKQKSC